MRNIGCRRETTKRCTLLPPPWLTVQQKLPPSLLSAHTHTNTDTRHTPTYTHRHSYLVTEAVTCGWDGEAVKLNFLSVLWIKDKHQQGAAVKCRTKCPDNQMLTIKTVIKLILRIHQLAYIMFIQSISITIVTATFTTSGYKADNTCCCVALFPLWFWCFHPHYLSIQPNRALTLQSLTCTALGHLR